ncbi:MAG: hypothetical protein AB7V46_20450, partial [Thermomicrobiales bacterium]
KVRRLLMELRAGIAERESQGMKWFEKSPVYGWEAPVLTDVVGKSTENVTAADQSVDALSNVGEIFDGNLTYQGRALHLMAQKQPVNSILRTTGWKRDIETDPFWLHDLPSSAPVAGEALPFVEVWSRYRHGLGKVASLEEMGPFLNRFAAENGRSSKGKGVLLNVHRNMLERLASYLEYPDQGHRKNMALAIAYDLAGYRPAEIAKLVGVDENVIAEGFSRIKRKGLNAYFKGLSMTGNKDDIAVMDRELRYRRDESAPRVFALYVFDGRDAKAIADRLGLSVDQVNSVIEQIHDVGADAYIDAMLMKKRR